MIMILLHWFGNASILETTLRNMWTRENALNMIIKEQNQVSQVVWEDIRDKAEHGGFHQKQFEKVQQLLEENYLQGWKRIHQSLCWVPTHPEDDLLGFLKVPPLTIFKWERQLVEGVHRGLFKVLLIVPHWLQSMWEDRQRAMLATLLNFIIIFTRCLGCWVPQMWQTFIERIVTQPWKDNFKDRRSMLPSFWNLWLIQLYEFDMQHLDLQECWISSTFGRDLNYLSQWPMEMITKLIKTFLWIDKYSHNYFILLTE